MSISSVSKKQLVLEIQGKSKLQCDLKRHLSPRTVGIILRSLPIDGHAHLMGSSIVYFETSIDSGIERSRTEFKKGEVAFLPSTGSFCFFKSDVDTGKAMTPIGILKGNIDELTGIRSGDVLKIYEDLD
ncbi:MAG: cyclophilin-like family protein [Nitrosopumilus sp.]